MTVTSAIKRILATVYLLGKTDYTGWTLKPSNRVVWIRFWGLGLLHDEELIYAFAQINALSKSGVRFRVSLTNNLGKFLDKSIFFTFSRYKDPFNFINYSKTLYHIASQLEEQHCRVFPRKEDILFWENKGHMTRKFIELGISRPRTILMTDPGQAETIDLPFPLLVKEEHSASSFGVHKINTRDELREFLATSGYFPRNSTLIVQELLNIRRDLRVILVGDRIVHYYWRINLGKEWMPTSTSREGSKVDFGNFPEHWRDFIIGEFRKLDLLAGAFDIVWQNDDLSTQPMILEVSPNFQPNPTVDPDKLGMPYGVYKRKLMLRNLYEYRFIDIVFRITGELIDHYLKKENLMVLRPSGDLAIGPGADQGKIPEEQVVHDKLGKLTDVDPEPAIFPEP